MNRLMLTLDAADGNCLYLYVSHGQGQDPVGRIRIVEIRGGHVTVAIEGDESRFVVFREKALRKMMGADAVDQLDQRFRN